MNDLDLVRTVRADLPAPAPERLAARRGPLLAATGRPAPRARRHWRLAVPIGAVAAAAAAAAAVLMTTAAPASPHVARGTTGPARQASLAARVLAIAADTVASQPGARPAGDQWIYSKFVQTQTGQAAQSDENWIRFDGSQSAYYQGGQLVVHDEHSPATPPADSGLAAYDDNITPLTTYDALASLPSSPTAILTAVGGIVGTTPQQWENWSSGSVVSQLAPATQGQAEFDYLAQLLWNAYAAAPGNAEANVYRAMADVPGVTVDPHMANAVGRPAIGVSANGGVSWLLLDPQTYQVAGLNEKTISAKSMKIKNHPLTFAGTSSMAWAQVDLVSQPGER